MRYAGNHKSYRFLLSYHQISFKPKSYISRIAFFIGISCYLSRGSITRVIQPAPAVLILVERSICCDGVNIPRRASGHKTSSKDRIYVSNLDLCECQLMKLILAIIEESILHSPILRLGFSLYNEWLDSTNDIT